MASTHDFGDARTGARGDWQSRIICAVVVHGSTAWATTGAFVCPILVEPIDIDYSPVIMGV
jgi:hypothetical protein